MSSDGSIVDLEINTKGYGVIPITISLLDDDNNNHIIEIKEWLNNNVNLIAPFVPHVKTLDEVIDEKIFELKLERLRRIQITMPAIENDEVLEMISELWLSVAGTARSPTAEWQLIIDIWQAAKVAGIFVKNLTVLTDVELYDVGVDPVWP